MSIRLYCCSYTFSTFLHKKRLPMIDGILKMIAIGIVRRKSLGINHIYIRTEKTFTFMKAFSPQYYVSIYPTFGWLIV